MLPGCVIVITERQESKPVPTHKRNQTSPICRACMRSGAQFAFLIDSALSSIRRLLNLAPGKSDPTSDTESVEHDRSLAANRSSSFTQSATQQVGSPLLPAAQAPSKPATRPSAATMRFRQTSVDRL